MEKPVVNCVFQVGEKCHKYCKKVSTAEARRNFERNLADTVQLEAVRRLQAASHVNAMLKCANPKLISLDPLEFTCCAEDLTGEIYDKKSNMIGRIGQELEEDAQHPAA
jgi:hypothetical protein